LDKIPSLIITGCSVIFAHVPEHINPVNCKSFPLYGKKHLLPLYLQREHWGTMLQAGRSLIRITDEVDFFNLPNPSSCTMALGSIQALTEMNTRNLPGGKKRPAHRTDNIAAIREPNV
jgi:hypothetical protein